jgi:hypothetical protein
MTVCCAVPFGGIIGRYIFEDEEGQTVTVNTEWYTCMVKTFKQSELNFCPLNSLWFQQGEATAHSSWIFMAVLVRCFQADSFLILGS